MSRPPAASPLESTLPAIALHGYPGMTATVLRRSFVVGGLFQPGRVCFHYWETDRTLIGGAMPGARTLDLPCPAILGAKFFNERRELGLINLGGSGRVTVDGRRHRLERFDCLYVGRGARRVGFVSLNPRRPAQFYLLSYPAHARYPTRLVRHAEVAGIVLGASVGANERVLYKYIHPGAVRSCQLMMGLTLVQPGSKWNTMPPHTHLRRSEVYLYFDLPRGASVKHYLGAPRNIRHLKIRDREAVLSPPWSIHCGMGTTHYGFIWGMGGENQDFADMNPVNPGLIR